MHCFYAKRPAGALLTLALIAMAMPLVSAETPSAQPAAGFFPPAWESPANTPLATLLSQHGTVPDWLPPGNHRSLVDILAAMRTRNRSGILPPPGITFSPEASLPPAQPPSVAPADGMTPPGMPVPMERISMPEAGQVLFESDALRIVERILEDPAAHPKLKTIRTLSLIDKTTGEEIYSEEHIPGQLLAGCRGTTCRTFERALIGNAVLPQSDGLRVARNVNDGLYVLQSADPFARPEAMMADPALAQFLKAEGNYLEPNGILRLLSTLPNDPNFGNLWGLHNTGQDLPVSRDFDVPKADGITDINAPEAWDIWTGDDNITVCVIDTGINYTLPDLAANIWTNPGEIPGNGIDDDGNGFIDDVHGYDFINNDGDPMDDHGHGTHVAGTIGAVGNNGLGIAGVMWKAKIMALKFLSAQGIGMIEDAVRAIGYATDMGCSLTSNSWGWGGLFSQTVYDAVARARDADSLFVAAAGNGGSDADVTPGYPAAYDLPNIISVAAIDAQGRLASFSNWGATSVDLGAPGVQVQSFNKDGGYNWWAGTSMATPHVSGVVGLMRSFDPSLPYNTVKALLLRSATPMPALEGKTVSGGRPDAHSALEAASSIGLFVDLLPVVFPGEGFLSPGETVTLPLTLVNYGPRTATGVEAMLTTSDPLVTVTTPMPLSYGTLLPDSPVSESVTIAVDENIPTPMSITFTLAVEEGRGHSFTHTFMRKVYTLSRIDGTVTNERYGTPIESATVTYSGSTPESPPIILSGSTLTDAEGRYSFFPLLDGSYTLAAQKEELLPSPIAQVTLPPDRIVDFQMGRPELTFAPQSFSFVLPQGQSGTQFLTIGNEAGTTNLDFEISSPTGSGSAKIERQFNFRWRSPFGIAFDGEFLWVTGDDASGVDVKKPGYLEKVNPADGTILDEIMLDNPACPPDQDFRALRSTTWDGNYIWSVENIFTIQGTGSDGCSVTGPGALMRRDAIIKIDPRTGEIMKRHEIPRRFVEITPITWHRNSILFIGKKAEDAYVLDRLMRMDPETGEIVEIGPHLPGKFQGEVECHPIYPPGSRCFGSNRGKINWGIHSDGYRLWAARWIFTWIKEEQRGVNKFELHEFVIQDDLSLRELIEIDVTSLFTVERPDGTVSYLRPRDIVMPQHGQLWLFGDNYMPGIDNNLFLLRVTESLPSWITVNPTAGEVRYAQTRSADITADTSSLATGSYSTILSLLANDPDVSFSSIPVSLTVVPPGGQPELCLQSTLQHRARRGMTHELSAARLTVTDTVTGTIVKEASLPMNEQGEARLTDTSGIEDGKAYDLTLKPRGHLPLILENVDDIFGSCHSMGEAKHGDYNETGRIDLSDLITAINYHVQRENSPHRVLFEDIYRLSFGLADIVEVIRNYVETR